MNGGTVITDFDEQVGRFDDAPFSLAKIFQGRANLQELERLNGYYWQSARLVDALVVQQAWIHNVHIEIERIHVGDTFSDITNSTIINRSHLHNALNSLANREDDPDAADALQALAEHVQNSQNQDAAENFDGLTEELEREVPRPARLKSFWSSLIAALPSVAQLSQSSEKLIELFLGPFANVGARDGLVLLELTTYSFQRSVQ